MAMTFTNAPAWAPARHPRKKNPAENLKRRIESDFVLRAKKEARRAQRRKENRFFVIVLAMVAVLLMLAGHLTYKAVIGNLPELRLNGSGLGFNRAEVSSFRLAGIGLGMTPAMVKDFQPSAEAHITDGDVTVMNFQVDNAAVTVWHLGPTDGQQAFRIRTQQTFDAAQEPEVLRSMAQQFGRPTSDSCNVSRIRGTTDCRYSWRAEGIDLKAQTRTTPEGKLHLALRADDVQMLSFLSRRKK